MQKEIAANLVGRYFLGTTAGMDPYEPVRYVWGQIVGQAGDLWTTGFFEWKENVSQLDPFRTDLSAGQVAGWRFFPTADELNAAVAELAQSHFVVNQYDWPKPAGKKNPRMKTPQGKATEIVAAQIGKKSARKKESRNAER